MKSIDVLIRKVGSWDELWNITQDLTNQDKGNLFERITELVLLTKPEYVSLLKNVWRQGKNVPTEVREHLRLPKTDEGIDLIAETHRGEYWAIQCKFKGDNSPPTYKEISTFGNLAHNYCRHISRSFLFHTGEKGVLKKKLLGETFTQVGLEFWIGLTYEDWQRIHQKLQGKSTRPTPRSPRPHQEKAIQAARNQFIKKKSVRGKLIMPCGTGKSLTAFWIAKDLKAQSIVVAVPSLSLIKQTLEDWTRELLAINERNRHDWLCICSDVSTGKLEKDAFVSDIYSLGIPTTTDVKTIKDFLNQKSKGKKIIFTTYQSSERLAEAAKSLKYEFDLAILDEAHKTVGEKSKSFATLLFDKNIVVKQRIFMTATERVVRGRNDDVLSMDDPAIYGDRFYILTFKEAIHSEPPIISDYKILTVMVTNDEIRELVGKNKLVTDRSFKTHENESQTLASAIALRKCYSKYGLKQAISFHSSIARAEDFRQLNDSLSESGLFKPLKSYHISSRKSAGERSQLLKEFSSQKSSLITNARCLTEGVDVPSIDCVLFADPKQSVVDIVQAVGRALRTAPGKKYGYILLPIIVPDGVDLEEFANSTPYRQIVRIITALSTQDERIAEEFRMIDQGKKIRNDRIINIIGNIPVGISNSLNDFIGGIETIIWQRVAKVNWLDYKDAIKYVHALNLKSAKEWWKYCKSSSKPFDIPNRPDVCYKGQGWQNYGAWLGTDTIASYKKEFLSYDNAKEFVHRLSLKNRDEWMDYVKSGQKPDNIPSNPYHFYKNNSWLGYNDWLGTGKVVKFGKFRDFKLARSFVHQLNLTNINQWRDYVKSGMKPVDIPSNPEVSYKRDGWKGYGDWLGTGTIAKWKRQYKSFDEAREFVHKLGLKNQSEWTEYAKSNKKPVDIPASPSTTYAGKGWNGFGDWLGTGRIANFNIIYRTFSEARKYVHTLNLKTGDEWKRYVKSGKKPDDIPSKPNDVYKNNGWVNMGDWLGTGRKANKDRDFLPYSTAKHFAQNLKLKSQKEWITWSKSGLRPNNIPSSPQRTYKDKGWIDWIDWLGN